MADIATFNFEGLITDGWTTSLGTSTSIDAGWAYQGASSFRCLTAGSAGYRQLTLPASHRVHVASMAFRWHVDTAGTASVYACLSTGGDMQLQLRVGRKLRVAAGVTVGADSAALNIDQVYVIDMYFDTTAGTRTAAYSIDGVAQAGASLVVAAADMGFLRHGNTGANNSDWNTDNLVIRDVAAEYPIGKFAGPLVGAGYYP